MPINSSNLVWSTGDGINQGLSYVDANDMQLHDYSIGFSTDGWLPISQSVDIDAGGDYRMTVDYVRVGDAVIPTLPTPPKIEPEIIVEKNLDKPEINSIISLIEI